MLFLTGIKDLASKSTHHSILSGPAIALCFSALSLLLLVMVLLSVPGPIKGLYWFSVDGDHSGVGKLTSGVLGWCENGTSNCTYAPLSDNPYLSSKINAGEALTVRILLPLACYWAIVTVVVWVLLLVIAKVGYRIKNLDSITRHLRVAVLEACVLCITLFSNVLTWLAFGFGRNAFLSVQRGGGNPHSGQAMETTAVAALMSLLSFFFAVWGLHLRLRKAQKHWKEEAIMVRRRSMALSAQGVPFDDQGRPQSISSGLSVNEGKGGGPLPEYRNGSISRGSMVKDPQVMMMDEEETLDSNLATARRNSRDQEMMVRRASVLSHRETPYAAAQNANVGGGQ